MLATDVLLKKFGGSTSLLKVTIETYLATWEGEVQTFQRSLQQRDASAVLKSAHRIKGFLGYLGDEEICQLAGEVEKAAKEGDLTQVDHLAPDMEERLQQLTEHL